MSRRIKSPWTEKWYILALCLICPFIAQAANTAASEDVVERYEQILERAPVEGPSFDKLLQIYQEGDGLEKLDERWAAWSSQPATKGAIYSLLRGLLADRMGKTDAARKFLQAATQAQPDDFHVWMALGDFEVRQGKWTDAVSALQKGLATNVTGDDRLALYRKLGQAQQRNLDVPAALVTWQKMVEEFPKDSFALEEAGGAELDAEQFDEAKKTFQKLVDLTEPNSMARVQALMHLAEVDDRQGKTEAAVHDYEAILPLTADSSWLNRELRAQIEQVYRREDDLAGLVAYYQKWTQDNPKDVEALLLLAGTLNELGKKPEALDVLRKVTALAPDRHEVRQSFAQALVEAKQYDEAISVLTALTADDPTEPRYWETMGEALWLKTQPPTFESKKAVLDAWAHIAPVDSKDVAAILRVADLCREHSLNDEALAGYQRALTLSPDASDIREKAVKLLIDTKRQDDAWKLLDQMSDGNLATAANYLKLATLDQQFDRQEAAEQAIQKGLALEPGNFDLLSLEWTRLAEGQKWSDCVALFDKLMAAAPNAYFTDQLEARQIQALTSAGMLDDTGKSLHAKLGTDPGMSESELRLLLRILIQKSDPDVAKALDEAHRRFPQSVSLLNIEIDYNRHIGNDDAAVAGLQKLIETVPQQKADWLGEIVHIRRDQGNLDEALKTAQQIIDASPASADGYLLYADIALAANKPDDAVEKLQAAINLSDKPNEVRQRLARYYLESGQTAKARTIYDEAFAAADNPQDKLTIVRAMTAAYFQDGQVEELVNKFKKEQNSEEGGWRYGLYLSAIDEQMEDYGAARRELAKSLAVRPKDTGLLHSLIGLATKENDQGELLQYREMLAEADPTVTNKIALANEYAVQNKPEQAWDVVQKNLGEVVKDPMAWKDVLNQITNPDYAAKVKGVLEEGIRGKSNSFEGKFALVQFQMQQGDLDGAKATLWDIIAQPLPPATAAPAPSGTKSGITPISVFNVYQAPLMQRVQQSYIALNEAQQLLTASQNHNMAQVQMNRARYYNRMGISSTLDPVAIKDHALIYLSLIAVQQKQAAEFLQELEGKIADWHWSIPERVVAYALIQAREPLLQVLEEQAKSGAPNNDMDQFGYMELEQFSSLPVDDLMRKRAEAVRDVLASRLASDPQFKSFTVMMELNRLGNDTSPEGVAKRNAAISDYVKTLDRKDPMQLFQAISYSAVAGNWADVKKATDDLTALDPAKWNVTTGQQLSYLPESILQQATMNKEVVPKEVIPAVLELMRLGYPLVPPHPTLPGSTATMGVTVSIGTNFYNQNTFPPPNRYFPMDRIGLIEPMYQQLKARDMLPAMYAGLDQEEKILTDWRKIYPDLMRIYFQWWDGKHDEAIASVRKLLEQDPSDDWKMLLASMLTLEQKYADAIPVLESTSARYGPQYIQTQMQLLHVARLAQNNDEGQKAALRLLALHLPQQEQMQILDDLRNVGLKDKADEIVKKQTQGVPGGNQMAAMQANNQLQQTLNQAMNGKDGTQAIELAHQILNRDPLASTQFGIENYLRIMALNALKKFDAIDGYTEDLEKQLTATPNSVRLNWLLGEAYSAKEAVSTDGKGLVSGYHWLKLQRTGNKFELFSSLEGKTWKPSGDVEMNLPPKLYVGMWVLGLATAPPTVATFDQVALTGKFTSADTPGAANPPVASSKPLPTPWQQIDIGKVVTPGNAVRGDTDDAFVFTGAIDGVGFSDREDAYHFVYQMLEGDGSMIVRVSDIYQQPDNTNCGLVMRESLDPGSRGVGTSVSRRRGLVWQVRNDAGSPWMFTEHREFVAPGWLKLARTGNTFVGSYSDDGQDWREFFSRQVAIKPDALAGMFIRCGGVGSSNWSEVKINGAAVPPPAGGSLPTSWQAIDIGPWTTPGKVDWKNTGVQLQSPVGLTTDDKEHPYGTFALTPVKGDGEIVVRLDALAPDHEPASVTGICFRDDTGLDAAEIYFGCGGNGQGSLMIRTNAAGQSVAYFQRVAELDPKNTALLVTLAEQLRRANKPGAAADLYVSILKTDFPTGMNQGSNVEQAFEQSNRLPEFVKIIQDWTPPPLTPMFGGGPDMYFVLVQLATQLKQGGHMAEAEQILRKALTVDTMQAKQDGVAALAQLLMDEGRRDDAAAEIEKWMDNKKAAAPALPILGFNAQVQVPSGWFQSMSWSSNGTVSSPITHFLELADAVGLSGKLKQELQARADKASPMLGGQIDSNRMAFILLGIVSRDPAYRPELEKLLKASPTSSGMGVNTNTYLILCQELGKWPEERPMALQLTRQLDDATRGVPGNNMVQSIIVRQMTKLAQAAGDHKAVQEILHKRVESIREQRAINPNQVPIDQMLNVIHTLVQEGMYKDAADLLADVQTDPQLQAQGANSYWKARITPLESQLAFAKDEKVLPSSLVFGIVPAETKSSGQSSGARIYWQLNGDGGQNSQVYFSRSPWWEGNRQRHTTLTIKVTGGPDENSEVEVSTLKNVDTQGSAVIKIPPGTQVLRAELLGAKSPAAVDTAPQGGGGNPIPARTRTPNATPVGYELLLGGPDNLLKNSNFHVSKDAAGKVEVDGWRGLLPGGVTQEKGGPLPVGGYQTLEATNGLIGGGSEIISDQIPIQPNVGYFFNGWMRLSGSVGFRYFDATGKVLNPAQVIFSDNDSGWQWRAWLLKGGTDGKRRREEIPPNAAFVQFVINPGQDSDFAGLSLRQWPAPPSK